MNYQTVLQNYLPVEQGDFMLKYEIDDRGYAIYSPEKGSFSCIELHGFSELTPWQLAFLLSLDMQQMKEQDEFSLSVCCKREKLLSYLFDVEESETTLKTISGITSKNGRNDAKRLNIRVVTMSNDDKPKNRKTQRKADLRRRMVCKSLPVKE